MNHRTTICDTQVTYRSSVSRGKAFLFPQCRRLVDFLITPLTSLIRVNPCLQRRTTIPGPVLHRLVVFLIYIPPANRPTYERKWSKFVHPVHSSQYQSVRRLVKYLRCYLSYRGDKTLICYLRDIPVGRSCLQVKCLWRIGGQTDSSWNILFPIRNSSWVDKLPILVTSSTCSAVSQGMYKWR